MPMRNRLIFFLIAGLFVLSCKQINTYDRELKESLAELDQALDMDKELSTRKESRIDSLRRCCESAPDSRALYLACNALFQEYHRWNVDSAYKYAYWKLNLARAIGSKEMTAASELDLANRHFLSSHYTDAIAMMKLIDTAVVASLGRLPEYRYLWYDIYHGLAQASSHGERISDYRQAEQAYLDLCDKFIESDCIEY